MFSSDVARVNPTITLHCNICSDNDSVFRSKNFIEYCGMLGYVRRYSTADSGHCEFVEAVINMLRALSRCMLHKTHLVKQKF